MTTTAHEQRRFDPHRLALPAEIGIVLIWGSTAGFSRYTHVDGIVFAFWRLWTGAACSWLVLRISGRRLTREHLKLCIPVGLIFAAHMAFYFTSITRTSVANVTVIEALQPVLILLFAARMFGERAGVSEWMLAAVAVAGVAVVVIAAPGESLSTPAGNLLAVFNLLVWTGYFLFGKRTRASIDALTMMAGVVLIASVAFTPVALALGHVGKVSARDFFWIVMVAWLPGTIGHTGINWAHKYVDVSVSSLMALGVPVVSAVFAWIEFGERITWVQAAGMLGVILALGFISVRVERGLVVDVAP
jgi:drug/metabolite transporter (DMT)-like permease